MRTVNMLYKQISALYNYKKYFLFNSHTVQIAQPYSIFALAWLLVSISGTQCHSNLGTSTHSPLQILTENTRAQNCLLHLNKVPTLRMNVTLSGLGFESSTNFLGNLSLSWTYPATTGDTGKPGFRFNIPC